MSSISSISSGMSPTAMGQSQSLSEEQKTVLEKILSSYDPENMTSSDADAMRQELKEAGIGPSRELMNTMKSAGFQPPAGGPKPPPPMGSGMGASGSSILDTLAESEESDDELNQTTLEKILEEYDLQNMTRTDLESLVHDLEDMGISRSPELFNMLNDLGFEPKEGKEGLPPMKAQGLDAQSMKSERFQAFLDNIEKYENGEIDKDALNSIIAKYQEMGFNTRGLYVDA